MPVSYRCSSAVLSHNPPHSHPYLSSPTNPCAPSHDPPHPPFHIRFCLPSPPIAKKRHSFITDIRSWTRLGACAPGVCGLSELPWCIMSYHIAFPFSFPDLFVSRGEKETRFVSALRP
ncbi:unnamed protein product [Tuber melanosporum]|uniref:(Perigord truffle) hypothetical protein n=1 Tax=Tuber melanosporum (strain Mel28) TaxID=656061 RepID=D5GA03_TUBMM|nr:uncharacterized protein GSTUM_00003476001 [Tuber melanosporum]CAZ81346.1 unnamed protein product [Tuber melanosporum]